jgi:hypothetical protein
VASLVDNPRFFFNTQCQFGVAEHSIADFFTLSRLSLNSLSARGVVGGEDLGCKQTSVSFFANLSIAKADFFKLSRLFLNSPTARGVVGGEDLGCQQTSVSFFTYLSIAYTQETGRK